MAEPQIYTFDEIQRMISAVYGQDSDVWSRIQYVEETGQYYGAIDEELANIGVEARTTPSGRILGYRQKVPLKNVRSTGGISSGNSNYQAAEYGGSRSVTTSATATKTTEAGRTTTTFEQGAKSVSTGTKVATVGMNVLNTIAVVGLASRLGKAVDDTFYDSGASWAFSDEDWNDLYWRSDGLGKFFLNVLYGVDGNNGTMYTDEEALAQTYMMLRAMGVYDVSSEYSIDSPTVGNIPQPIIASANGYAKVMYSVGRGVEAYYTCSNGLIIPVNDPRNGGIYFYAVSRTGNPIVSIRYRRTDLSWNTSTYTGSSNNLTTLVDGNTFYFCNCIGATFGDLGGSVSSLEGCNASNLYSYCTISNSERRKVGTVIFDGSTESPVDGVEDDEQATTYIDPSLIDGQDRDTVLQQLKTYYPELFDGAIYQDVPQKDGTMDRHRYIPTPIPNIENENRPVTGANHQNNPSVNPETNTETLLEKIIDIISNPNTPNDIPDTGEGDTPTTVIPTGSASSLWAVYNPTQAELNSFGAWLWSSDLVEQIKKLFSDPMQAIIGVHKVFATPATGAAQTIKCGYIDSGVSAAVVTSQYTTINCGTVNLREYFGNVFDYAPFTEVSLYLPFIGIVRLDVADVMRASITVRYHVDVITGACLADVIVNRDSAGGVLYQYSGSAIVTYPISSGSYASAMAGVLSIAGGIVGTIASGGAAAPALLGAAVGASHLHSDVQKSGSFSGAAGAMGGKIPYLIISRPQTAMPSSFKHLEGYPANHYTKLGDASGYVKVRAVQVKGINATDTELDMIDAALRQGVEL